MSKGIDLSLGRGLPGLPDSQASPAWMKLLDLLAAASSPADSSRGREPALKPLSRGSLPLFKALVARDAEVATLRRNGSQELLWANAALHWQWGLSLPGMSQAGLAWLDLIHPQDRARVQALFQALSAPASFELEYRLCLPTGAVRQCRERGCLALSEEGELQILSMTEDLGSASHAPAQVSPGPVPEAANDALAPEAAGASASSKIGRELGSKSGATIHVLRNDLRAALRRNELRLLYQPQIDLRNAQVSSMEALLRWERCDGTLVLPVQFIGLAEQYGLINELGEWVLQEAGQQWRRWQTEGQRQRRIAVNVSALQLASDRFMPALLEAVPQADLMAGALQIEITESSLMGHQQEEERNLARLAELGVPLALDDFGTGYANFAMLKRLPLDCLKIDQSLVADLPGQQPDRSIVRAIIAMAHQLHLRVVAEGVESQAQCRCLQALCCDEVQGFLFTPPVSATAVQALMHDWQGDSSHRSLADSLGLAAGEDLPMPSPMMAPHSEPCRCSAHKT
ncbi:hypothetical protein DBR47_09725 [Paucibacter sp. KBW04]|uniref:bifunctional diguanylate cyclase/phosphodiesterase n=1 Tax=Paucibacter sp. KBW04 TaxID=2153361 RepID=UPI000F58C544|nr:EAL domain-containing protein [Paucibacter sp. KBW04]RQO60610.1 hypothetical protein DBR47_09725 [Paucibacter sp. KBW04]